MGKATDFKFGRYIHRLHPNKSPLKILEKRERGHIQGLPKDFKYPLLSRKRVKLRTSNFVRTLYDRLQQKPVNNFEKSSRGRSQGLPKFFRASIYGASRGHLCDSTAFLLELDVTKLLGDICCQLQEVDGRIKLMMCDPRHGRTWTDVFMRYVELFRFLTIKLHRLLECAIKRA